MGTSTEIGNVCLSSNDTQQQTKMQKKQNNNKQNKNTNKNKNNKNVNITKNPLQYRRCEELYNLFAYNVYIYNDI